MSLLEVVVTILDHPLTDRLIPVAQQWVTANGDSQKQSVESERYTRISEVLDRAAGSSHPDAKADDLYRASNQYDTGCAVCGKAHLAATSGMMDRADALSHERGQCDDDCGYYVAAAQREVVNLVGYDWTDEAIAATPDQERIILERWSPQVTALHPILFAGPESQSRINLAKAAGALEEAGRFARADGIQHPEAQRRITDAEAWLAETERGEWSPERRQQMDPNIRAVVDHALPAFRKQRQFLLNGLQSPEDLDRVAAEVGTLNAQMQSVTIRELTPDQIHAMADATRQVRKGFRDDLDRSKGASS